MAGARNAPAAKKPAIPAASEVEPGLPAGRPAETPDLRGGLTHRTTMDAYRKGAKEAAPEPAQEPAPPQLAAMNWPADAVERRPIGQLVPSAQNARLHSEQQVAQLAASMRTWGWTMPVLVDEAGEIIAGHGRILAAQRLGFEEAPCMTARGWSPEQIRAYRIADNKLALNGSWDDALLKLELSDLREAGFDLGLTGFSTEELQTLWHGAPPSTAGNLAERFGVPPFSVLNAREGWWQDRKAAWLRLGIKSELGRANAAVPGGSRMPGVNPATGKIARTDSKAGVIKGTDAGGGEWAGKGGNALYKTGGNFDADEPSTNSGTSIFDPVLCELAYRWFAPPGGIVLDPFAGGSVRGIVAARLGRAYVGLDLSAAQLAANREQAKAIIRPDEPMPRWIEGDSRHIDTLARTIDADFLFSCPPYADLERYSDDPADLSTLSYPGFREDLAIIIGKACARLKANRFACFVVGDVRGKNGDYYGFPADVIRAFVDAGLALYNEAVLVTAVGSLPIRAAKQFAATRKLGKTHQNVLVFLKGDARAATSAIGEPEFGAISEEEPAASAGLGGEVA